MSTVTGIPPVVHALNVSGGAPNSTNTFTDTRAINYLLNVSNSDWSINTIDMQAASHNLLLSQSANKSVAVFYNTQNNITTVNITAATINTANNVTVQSFSFNMSSTILTSEAYQFKTVPPTAAISNQQQPFELTLTPLPTSQNEVNGLNDIRILNQSGLLPANFSVNYSAANVTNALGVEAKAYFANGSTAFAPYYSAIASANLVAENNISMTFATTNDNAYVYQLQRFQYADPTFTTSGNSSSVVSSFGGSSLQNVNVTAPYSYTAFLAGAGGLNYSGQLGANISAVLSDTLALTLSNGGASRAFTQSGGFTGIDNATNFYAINNLVNATQLNMTFANSMTINLTAATATINNTSPSNPLPIFNSTLAMSVVQVAESLPVGHGQDNILLNFNSNTRFNLTNTNYGVTAQIVYLSDGNLVQTTSLSEANMAAAEPVYNTTVIGGNTYNNTAGSNGLTTASANGINCFYPQSTAYGFSISGANTTVSSIDPYYCMIGKIQASATMNFTNWLYNSVTAPLTPTHLPILFAPANSTNFNASNSYWNNSAGNYLQLDDVYPSNGQLGFGVLGGAMDSVFQTANAAECRLRLAPTNPVLNCSINVTNTMNASFMFNNASFLGAVALSYANPSGLLTYNSTYVAAGPVSYEDYPSLYSQRYTLVFPTISELNNGIMRVQSILVDGFNSTNGSPLPTSTTRTIQVGRANVTNFCINQCASSIPGVTDVMISYTIVINAALSGVLPYDASNTTNGIPVPQNAIKLSIPVSYTIQNDGTSSGYTYGPNAASPPSAAVWISWLGADLYTHVITLQGRPGVTSDWNDLGAYPATGQIPVSYNIDLRESYDILSYQSGSLYTLNFCLYPKSNFDFNNINYEMPLGFVSSGLSSKGWSITSANVTTLNALTGFGQAQLDQFATTFSAQSFNFNANMTAGIAPQSTRVTIVNQAGLSLDLTVNYSSLSQPIYFIASRSALVSVNGQGVTQNVLMINNAQALIDNGVYLQATGVAGALPVPSSLARVNLNADQYSAQAYSGQSGVAYNSTSAIGLLALTSGAPTLIPSNITGSAYTTDAVLSSVYRGYRTATYTISRSALGMSAVFGQYSQNVSNIVPYTVGNPTVVTLNMAENFGIQLMITANSANNTSTSFTVNKTQVTAVYTPVAGPGGRTCNPSNPNGSIQLINMVNNLGALVPWIDTLNLNNFFNPTSTTMTLSYNQAPIVVSIAQPNCVAQGQNGNYAVANAVWVSQPQSISDASLVGASYLIQQAQTNLQYASSYVLRNKGKTFYATIAPVDVTINHILGVGNGAVTSMSPRYISLGSNPGMSQVQSFVLPTVDNGVTLSAPMTLTQLFRVADFKATPAAWVPSNFNYQPLLYSLRGAPVQNIVNYTGPWYSYFNNQDLRNFNASGVVCTPTGDMNATYLIQFVQAGSEQSLALLSFSSALMRDQWDSVNATYGWSSPMYVNPATISNLTQYELTFALSGSGSNYQLKPVIKKYISQTYNSAFLGASGTTMNGLGYVQPLIGSTASYTLNMANFPSIVSSLNGSYPYAYVGAGVEYPTPASVGSVNVTNSDWIYTTPPTHMDLTWKVTDTNNMTAGTTLYSQIMAVVPGNYSDAKVLNIFAKDQLVITDYAGNLGLRVGPDGHMYSGDISSYSLIMNNNNNRLWNGAYVPMYNSDVQLNAGQPNSY